MLSIGKARRWPKSATTPPVAAVAGDYYSGRGEAEGYWLGNGAADLGLQGKVHPAQLSAMLTGANPTTGEPLGLRHDY